MPPYAFYKNEYKPLGEAKMGVMTHASHYGTACFEGIRANWNSDQKQLYLFRPFNHYRRLFDGCRILKIKLPYTAEDLVDATVKLVAMTGFKDDVYVRPLAYKTSETVGVRLHDLEDDVLIIATTLPNYLDLEKGIRCCTSSWRRVDDTMIPARAKITGIYVNSALAKTEAVENGYDEAIMLNHDGHVSEGSGENIFMVLDNKLVTPPSSDNILLGITRKTVMELAQKEMGIETHEVSLDLELELYLADECFLTGTAAHVTPVLEIDHRPVGNGQIGKVTKELQRLYFEVIQGRNSKYIQYCTPVYPKAKA